MADTGSRDIALIGSCVVLPDSGGRIFCGRTQVMQFSPSGLEDTSASAGVILRSDGTNYVASTLTMPDTAVINRILYASAANVISALATANSSVLVTSGAGVPSLATDIPTAVTIGTAYIHRVGGTDVALADGGTNASLTASVGGIFYSTASAGAILAGTATAGQLLRSGSSAAPTWSTLTFPATAAVSTILYASATNVISALATANSGVLITSATGVPSIGTTLPALARIASVNSDAVVLNKRTRVTLAQINAGFTLLAAVTDFKYRLIGCTAIAIGGAAGGLTAVEVRGTQAAGAAILVSYAQASLTQSTVLKDGGAGTTVLADGASYIQNDATTAITVIKAGADLTTATDIDINLTYALEA